MPEIEVTYRLYDTMSKRLIEYPRKSVDGARRAAASEIKKRNLPPGSILVARVEPDGSYTFV